MPTEASVETGSFRDRDSRVVVAGGAVFRVLSERGAEDWRALASSELLERLTSEGSLVATEEAALSDLGTDAPLLPDGVAAVLRHERIPFVSYPYEWTFGMLRDAALLQLDLELEALEQGLTLKDATPYNVQFRGSEPVFIDVGSFEQLREGEPWAGYRQFCMLYLYPLLLQAYKEISFQPWLRGSIDGITPREAARFFSLRDRFRKGVFTHVALHARLERRYEEREGGEVKEDLKKANFKTSYVKANVQRMRKLVSGLSWKAGDTAWTGLPRAEHLHRRGRRAQAGLRPRGRRGGRSRRWSGTWAATTAPTRGSPPRAPATSSPSTTTTPRSRRSTARCAPRRTGGSCRWSRTSPTPPRGWDGAGSSAGRSSSAASPT